MTEANPVERGYTLTRILDAPRDLVFQAWTDPEQLVWFYNPEAATPEGPIEVDLRVGGTWRLKMVINEETEYFTGGIYREIEPFDRLSFIWGATDGWPKIDPDSPDDGALVTLQFNDIADSTEMIFTLTLPENMSDDEVREWLETPHMRQGWSDTIDRIVGQLAGR